MLASFPAVEHAGQKSTGVSGTEAPTTPSQREALHQLPARPKQHRRMEERLQCESPTHEPRWAHPAWIRNPIRQGSQREQG